MSIENRIRQAQLEQQQRESAIRTARENDTKNSILKLRQQWAEFGKGFFQQKALIEAFIHESRIPQHLRETKRILGANIETAIFIGDDLNKYILCKSFDTYIGDYAEKMGNARTWSNIIESMSRTESYFGTPPSLSNQVQIYKLKWNSDIHYYDQRGMTLARWFGGKPTEFSNNQINISVDTLGSIVIMGADAFAIPLNEWRHQTSILETRIGDAILNPSYWSYPPSRSTNSRN